MIIHIFNSDDSCLEEETWKKIGEEREREESRVENLPRCDTLILEGFVPLAFTLCSHSSPSLLYSLCSIFYSGFALFYLTIIMETNKAAWLSAKCGLLEVKEAPSNHRQEWCRCDQPYRLVQAAYGKSHAQLDQIPLHPWH